MIDPPREATAELVGQTPDGTVWGVEPRRQRPHSGAMRVWLQIQPFDPDDTRGLLSKDELRARAVEACDKVWWYLARLKNPAVGPYRVGRMWVRLYSTDGRGLGASRVILPGRRPKLQIDELMRDAPRTGRIACEIGKLGSSEALWHGTAPVKEVDRLLGEADCAYGTLSPRDRVQVNAFPLHLVCYLLHEGCGQLARRDYGEVAQIVFGLDMPLGHEIIGDECRPEWRAVRAHVAAARSLIARAGRVDETPPPMSSQ